MTDVYNHVADHELLIQWW